MRKLRKFLIYFFILLVLLVLAVVISIRFFPQLYLSAFNHFSDDQISAEQLDINFVPLEVTIGNLGVTNAKKATIVKVEKTKLSAQVMAWYNDKQNFWKASVSNADVQLLNLPETSSDSSSSSTSSKINVHKILSGLDLQIDGTQVQIDDKQSVYVERLYTSLNDRNLSDYRSIEQDIEFAVSFVGATDANDLPLKLSGLLQSRYVDGVSVLKLAVDKVDLAPFAPADAATSAADVEASVAETVMDWQWLSSFEPLQVDANVGEVLWSKSSIRDIALTAKLDQVITFSYKSGVEWLESDEFSFKDNVELAGQWQPILPAVIGADLRGESTLVTSALNLKLNGDVNVNGATGNKLSIELDSTKVPVEGLLDEQTQALVDQYFPIKTVLDVQQSAESIDLQIAEAKLGDSDLKGQVSLNTNTAGPLGINAKIESTLFSYKGVESDGKSSKETEPEEQSKSKGSTVFNDDVIDWSWMDTLLVDFDWKAKRVLVDDIEVKDLYLPLSISKDALTVSGLKALFGGGEILSDTSLIKKEEKVDVDFNLTASDVVLEQLKLLPPEELKNGITDLSVALKTGGKSSRDLAQSLDGNVKINVGDGVIGNDSFELIGSDLILNLLNKLNPFSKKDKTTKLECAVVNLNIEKGKIDIDKSLALRTSKLTMVADGNVNLSSEKIKLSLTPKARQGVGVDVSSLVKFIALGGTLSKPAPTVTASGLLKSAAVVGAAVSTGGVSLLATSVAEKTVAKVDVCKRANNAFK